MKRENVKKSKSGEKDLWIDVHDDDVMREMGFMRPYDQTPRDESVWTKTPKERKQLKKLKYSCPKRDGHFYTEKDKFIKVRNKLIIQLKKNKKYRNSTYSKECWESDIPYILSKYKGCLVSYSFNGKTVRVI